MEVGRGGGMGGPQICYGINGKGQWRTTRGWAQGGTQTEQLGTWAFSPNPICLLLAMCLGKLLSLSVSQSHYL